MNEIEEFITRLKIIGNEKVIYGDGIYSEDDLMEALSESIKWGEAILQAEGELGEKKDPSPYKAECSTCGQRWLYEEDKGYNKMHNIASKIIAKDKLVIENLKKENDSCDEVIKKGMLEIEELKKTIRETPEKIKAEWLNRVDKSLNKIKELQNEILELKKSKLTKEEFRTIACEYRPSIAEDSGQPEWNVGELDELWEGLTRGGWLYINRDKEIAELQEKVKELENNHIKVGEEDESNNKN